MALDTGNYISDFDRANPTATDLVSEGDDVLRFIKKVLQKTFPMGTDAAGTATGVGPNQAVQVIIAKSSAPTIGGSAAESMGLVWLDTSNDLVKMRNQANDAWITLPLDPEVNQKIISLAGTIDGTVIGGSTAAAVTGTTIVANTSVNIAGDGATVTGIKDEDDLSSDSAVKLATQQSIKAYVDSQVTAQDLDITTDSGTIDIDLDSETLTVAGGSGLDTAASSTTVTVNVTDEGITNAKLAHMAANTVKVRDANSSGDPSDKALATTEILIGDGTGFTAAALSGDATMTNAGAVTVAKIQGEAVSSTSAANDQYLKYSSASNEWQKVNIVGDDKLTTKGDLLAYNTVDSETRFGVGTNDYVLMADSSATNGFNWKQVDTDTVADNAVSLAKMSGLARGNVIYGDASGDPAALAVGTSGYVLKSDGTDIAWSAVPEADMAANTVKVRDADSSGAPSNKALATTEILIGDGTGFTAAALSGDVTMTNAGAVTVASGAVENSMLANMAANTVKVRDANSSGAPSDVALATTEILIGDGTGFTAAALSSDVTMTNAGAVTIADNAVSLAKMAGLVRGKIIYGDASGDPAALTVGGANEVLTSDGTDVSWAAAAGGGAWELVASVTAAANASTTIGGDASPIFSSSHDNYVLIGTMRSNQDGFTPVQIQPILAGSGTTADTTDDVSTTGPMMRSNTALGSTALTWSMQDVLNAYNVSLNYNPMGTATGEAHSFQMWFYDPFQNASFDHGQLANAMVSSWDSNDYSEVLTYGYKKPTTTAYVGLVISNNATGGVDYQLRLYGIKNS